MSAPAGQTETWDCHVHVFGPQDRFAMAQDRLYTPGLADVDGLIRHLDRHGLDRTVVVQPSVYGLDNACLLDALARLDGRGRGIAAFDPGLAPDALRRMHSAGVRGVRLNLETSAAKDDPQVAARMLHAAARQVGDLGWQVQIYANPAIVQSLAEAIAGLSVPVVIDHFGMARAEDGAEVPVIGTLQALCRAGHAHVKISLADRLAADPQDMAPLARALLDAAPDRILWGSDWPHSRRGAKRGDPSTFGDVDDAALLSLARDWCATSERIRRVLSTTPAALFC